MERVCSWYEGNVGCVVGGAEVLPEGGKWFVFCLQVDWHIFDFFIGEFLLFNDTVEVVLCGLPEYNVVESSNAQFNVCCCW